MTRRWLAFIAVSAVLLGGCSKKQEANETLPSPSTAETTPELPPLGPDDMPMPAEARTQDAAGAEAFVRYYFGLLNRSLGDMDPQYLRQFAGEACDVCERIASETEADRQSGYTYRGGELTIPDNISVVITRPNEAQSAFTAVQAPMTVLNSTGDAVPGLEFDGEPNLSSGTITNWNRELQSWTMSELTLG